MRSVTLTLPPSDGGCEESVVGTFERSDVELLGRFTAAVKRLRESALLTRGMPVVTSISWERQCGLQFICGAYSDSELHELLHVLRPLILQQEATSYHRIAALFGRRFENRRFRDDLKIWRHTFEHGQLSHLMQVSVGSIPLLHGETLKQWLNGEQYHGDEEKRANWQRVRDALTDENVRAYVINQLAGKVMAVFMLDGLAQRVLAAGEPATA